MRGQSIGPLQSHRREDDHRDGHKLYHISKAERAKKRRAQRQNGLEKAKRNPKRVVRQKQMDIRGNATEIAAKKARYSGKRVAAGERRVVDRECQGLQNASPIQREIQHGTYFHSSFFREADQCAQRHGGSTGFELEFGKRRENL